MSKSSIDKKKNTASTPWNGPPPQTERDLLAIEAETAKSALVKTARAAARNLFRLADPRAWTEDYPWKSTGIAAVAGFFVATRGNPPSEPANSPSQPESTPKGPSPWDLLTSTLLSTGTEAVKGALTPWLAEKMQQVLHATSEAKATEVSQETMDNEGKPDPQPLP